MENKLQQASNATEAFSHFESAMEKLVDTAQELKSAFLKTHWFEEKAEVQPLAEDFEKKIDMYKEAVKQAVFDAISSYSMEEDDIEVELSLYGMELEICSVEFNGYDDLSNTVVEEVENAMTKIDECLESDKLFVEAASQGIVILDSSKF